MEFLIYLLAISQLVIAAVVLRMIMRVSSLERAMTSVLSIADQPIQGGDLDDEADAVWPSEASIQLHTSLDEVGLPPSRSPLWIALQPGCSTCEQLDRQFPALLDALALSAINVLVLGSHEMVGARNDPRVDYFPAPASVKLPTPSFLVENSERSVVGYGRLEGPDGLFVAVSEARERGLVDPAAEDVAHAELGRASSR